MPRPEAESVVLVAWLPSDSGLDSSLHRHPAAGGREEDGEKEKLISLRREEKLVLSEMQGLLPKSQAHKGQLGGLASIVWMRPGNTL